jgi:hypothetical protein
MRENTPGDSAIAEPAPEDTAMNGWVDEDAGPYLSMPGEVDAPDEIDDAPVP